MSKVTILSELYEFLMARRKWWLMIIFGFLLLFGVLIVFTEGSAIAPFIYALF